MSTFDEQASRLAVVVAAIKHGKETLKAAQAAMREETAPIREKVAELEAEEKALRLALAIELVQIKDSTRGKVRSFGGVALVEGKIERPILPPEDSPEYRALAAELYAQGLDFDDEPVVRLEIRAAVLARLVKHYGPPEGVEVGRGLTVKLESEKEDE